MTWTGTAPTEARLRLRAELPPAPEPPWWLVPGALYGENRPAACALLGCEQARDLPELAAEPS